MKAYSATLHDLRGRSVIVGAGLAGLTTALRLAEYEPTALIATDRLGEQCASVWAQGGIAAAIGRNDTPQSHAEDTLKAGDALCVDETVARITKAAPTAINLLLRYGVEFDRDKSGLKLGLEAAHSHRRIIHAKGDGSGREIMRALIACAHQNTNLLVLEGLTARRILTSSSGHVAGLLAADAYESSHVFMTSRAVLATGGLGGLYLHTTNPSRAIGHGLAMAARIGATLADMEFIQFHPTALDVGLNPMPLVSEAVRGEGATLINDLGERFLAQTPGAELASRDIVARSVWRQLLAGRQVYLDASAAIGSKFRDIFPGIYQACWAANIDPSTTPIPIRPASHYHMGGICVDSRGRTDVPGLWACGEVASTGLHGANRLASNSLLEATVCGAEVAEDVHATAASAYKLDRSQPPLPPPPSADLVRPLMDRYAGVLRDKQGLEDAAARLQGLIAQGGPAADPALTAAFIVHGALKRRESRGGHFRTDFPIRADLAERSMQNFETLQAELGLSNAA